MDREFGTNQRFGLYWVFVRPAGVFDLNEGDLLGNGHEALVSMGCASIGQMPVGPALLVWVGSLNILWFLGGAVSRTEVGCTAILLFLCAISCSDEPPSAVPCGGECPVGQACLDDVCLSVRVVDMAVGEVDGGADALPIIDMAPPPRLDAAPVVDAAAEDDAAPVMDAALDAEPDAESGRMSLHLIRHEEQEVRPVGKRIVELRKHVPRILVRHRAFVLEATPQGEQIPERAVDELRVVRVLVDRLSLAGTRTMLRPSLGRSARRVLHFLASLSLRVSRFISLLDGLLLTQQVLHSREDATSYGLKAL